MRRQTDSPRRQLRTHRKELETSENKAKESLGWGQLERTAATYNTFNIRKMSMH